MTDRFIAPSVPAAPRIAVLVGNPRPGSRTRAAAETFAAALAGALDASTVEVLDLAVLPEPDAGPVAGADVLVVATPVYKASYTGLLKSFLDRLPAAALAGTVAVPVTVAAASSHRLLADLQLRPVLAELGASLPVPSFVLEEHELPGLGALAEVWAERHTPVLRAVVAALRQGVSA